MEKALVKTIDGVAVFKDEDGYYFEGNIVPFETEKEVDEEAEASVENGRPLTDDEGVRKMFKLGLIRIWFQTTEQKKITEKWSQIDDLMNEFIIDSDGVLRVYEDSFYDVKKHSLIFKNEESKTEFTISLVEVEKCLNIEIGIVTLAG